MKIFHRKSRGAHKVGHKLASCARDASREARPKGLTDDHIRVAKRVSSLDQTGEGEEQWPEGWGTAAKSWTSFFTAFKKASVEWTSAPPGTSEEPEPDNSQQHDQLQEANTDLECRVPPTTVDPEHPEFLLDLSQDLGLSLNAERPVRVEHKTVGTAQRPSESRHIDAEYPKPNPLPEEGLGHKESRTTTTKSTPVTAQAPPSTSLADPKEKAPKVLSWAEPPHPGSSLSPDRRDYSDMQRERGGTTIRADIPARSTQPEPSIAGIASTQAQPMQLRFAQAMTSVQKCRREAKAAGRSRFK
ncbi:hypothetical protein CEP52_017382 [Fusarium oligoseptatum]|uniref:Uncharacterized protein n=1 Tax=Fusarium oligoseptatum TaxID=2604345 RepID=A0A428RSG4_9HYPO|nr:hypothetical protein CEP52_017382 [Fusarium oligoseptatum]